MEDALPAGELAPGVALGRFVVKSCLGSGGMGEVWEATDSELGRVVALKVMASSRAASERMQDRLRREAQVMARVAHPNIAVVHDVGCFGGRVFVAMELMQESLRAWLAKGQTWRAIVERFIAAARGLGAAHRAGIVHRDFKPDNVLLGFAGETKVADFGLADGLPSGFSREQEVQLSARLATDEGVAGTPAYMAPEQILGANEIDARADQFSFCVSLWEGLYGGLPYQLAEVPGVPTLALRLAAITAGRLAAPPQRTIPRVLERVMRRGLDPDPAARFASMDEVAEVLAKTLRRRSVVPVAAVLALVAATIVVIVASRRADAPPPAGWVKRSITEAVPYRRSPMVSLAHDGRMAILDGANAPPTLHLATIDGVERTRIDLPSELAPTAVAIAERSGAVFVGGRRGTTWELWRTETGRAPVLIGEVPALAKPTLTRPYMVALDDHAAAVVVDGSVVQIARGATHTLVPRAPAIERDVLAVSPSATRIAVLEYHGGSPHVRLIDRSGATLQLVGLGAVFIQAISWLDEARIVLSIRTESRTDLVALDLATRERAFLGHVDGLALRAHATAHGIAVETYTRMATIEVREGDAGHLLNLAGWSGKQVAGWSDDSTLVVTARLAKAAVLAVSPSGGLRLLASDDDLAAAYYYDGELLVLQDLIERGCSIRVVRANETIAKLAPTCAGDPHVLCARLSGPCLLAQWEHGVFTYRRLDPRTLAVGDIVLRDRAQTAPVTKLALSPDAGTLAIPMLADGLRFVTLATGRETFVPAVHGTWYSARWLTNETVAVGTSGEGEAALLEVKRDGTTSRMPLEAHDAIGEPSLSPDGKKLAYTVLDIDVGWTLFSPPK